MTDKPVFSRGIAWGLAGLLLASGAAGCKRKDRNPLMATPAAGTNSITMAIRGVDPSQTPYVNVLLQVLGTGSVRLTDFQTGNFSIVEDGKPVVPRETGKVGPAPFSATLVIDRSGSMAGTPTTAANNAAIAFVNALSANSQCALVEFESTAKISINFTSDKAALTSYLALATAPSGGTAFYDGVFMGAGALSKQGGVKLMIALGDGDDNSSSHTLADTVGMVQGTGMTVYTVALGLGIADTSAYRQIAEASGGQLYTSATGADLTAIFLGILNSTAFQDLIYVKYRQLSESRNITVYLSYGDLVASASARDF